MTTGWPRCSENLNFVLLVPGSSKSANGCLGMDAYGDVAGDDCRANIRAKQVRGRRAVTNPQCAMLSGGEREKLRALQGERAGASGNFSASHRVARERFQIELRVVILERHQLMAGRLPAGEQLLEHGHELHAFQFSMQGIHAVSY